MTKSRNLTYNIYINVPLLSSDLLIGLDNISATLLQIGGFYSLTCKFQNEFYQFGDLALNLAIQKIWEFQEINAI